ncbi:four helix bundle protein [bacterium]|nr:four helix bundle protein [bacterium]
MPDQDGGRYDLEERTFEYARDVRKFLKTIPRSLCSLEDGRQLIRSSGSVGANYIEANESLGRKDFLLHVKISRKAAKESCFWLRLIEPGTNDGLKAERDRLVKESRELMNIFGAILQRSNHHTGKDD